MQLELVGGHPILDFVNTVENQDKLRTISMIGNWQSFSEWARNTTLFSEFQLSKLVALEGACVEILEELHSLREMIYEVLLRRSESSESVLPNELIGKIKAAIGRADCVSTGNGYEWRACMNKEEWPIDSVILSFESFLRTEDLSRLKVCGRCSWMFLNTGRGRGRRWCSMTTCGNREKSNAFRQRKAERPD